MLGLVPGVRIGSTRHHRWGTGRRQTDRADEATDPHHLLHTPSLGLHGRAQGHGAAGRKVRGPTGTAGADPVPNNQHPKAATLVPAQDRARQLGL